MLASSSWNPRIERRIPMEGTIKIEALPGMGVSLEADVKNVSRLDILGIFDALAAGFGFDEEDRKRMGIMFAMGGVNAIPGAKATKVEIGKELFEMLKKMKENDDETAQ
jgi:hypothetical protein